MTVGARMFGCLVLLWAGLSVAASAGEPGVSGIAGEDFPGGQVSGLLQRHCGGCHGAEVQSGGLRLDQPLVDSADKSAAAVWERVHDRIQAGQMPPAEAQPADWQAEREQLLSLLRGPLQIGRAHV